MMQNKMDLSVAWHQGLEFYLGLRRLGKVAWMLEYEGEGHSLANDCDQRDFSIRLYQFFNHYLKGAPMPKWMAAGIPAEMSGIDNGLQLSK
jgi:hypothetical protein